MRPRVISGAMLLSLAVAMTVASAAPDAAGELRRALELETQGKRAESRRAVDALVRALPAWELPRLELGRQALADGDSLDLAEYHLDIARSLAPENPRAHYLYGLVEEERRHPEGALHSQEVALALRADYDDARLRLAGLLFARGEFSAALPHFKAYAKAHPEATAARLQLAAAAEKAGGLVDAERELRALFEQASTRALGGRRLAEFYERRNQLEKARKVRAVIDPPKKTMRPLH